MKVLILLVFLPAGCLAFKPKPCASPPRMTGKLSVSTSSGNLTVYGKYIYDAPGKRIRLRECGSHDNKTFHLDVLLLYKEKVMYDINYKNKTCTKKPLNTDFHPLAVPKKASLLGQVVLGTSSRRGQGLLVNTWAGKIQTKNRTAKYISTVTEFGCIPVTTLFHGNKGWVVTSFFDNIIGIKDPKQLSPPSFCKGSELEEEDGEDPETFFSLFENTELESDM
ncbi:ependymin-2-like [Betta splendens]|uniref:Ependymin-2-like n=1 Tax=Betta splendens TaxID=158456 RepID=A0A9W2XMI9_BETSP|nr:ependymin-2-like [Betta splendens]